MPRPAPELTDTITRAGAGAGKTTGLVNRVVEVFREFRARGETPRIVLTTFTRKATQELKERLIARACRDLDAELLQFVSDPSRLQIATIHGLLNTFLRQLGHLAGLDAGFRIVSEAEGYHLSRLALREVIIAGGEGLRWLETYGFNRTLGMCRAYAAARREAGTLRPASLAEIAAAADAEVAAWRDQLTKLSADILDDCPDAALQTYARGLADFVEGWDGDGATIAVPRKPNSSKKKPELDGWHQRISDEVNAFKDEMKRPCWSRAPWPAMIAEWAEFQTLAEAFDDRLDALKEAQARFEMSDLELKAMDILRAKPFLGAIFAENWDYWLIDEYQDTSPLQVAVLNALIGDRPKYLVGDPQQSIYLFRGAEVRVFDEAERAIAGAGGATHEMRRNWRSRPDLLLFMNDFMAGVGGHHFLPMEPRAPGEGPTRACARLIRVTTAEDELAAVVARVGELVEAGARLEQICVLGRTHGKLMDVSRALKDFDYPTHVHSSRGFETRREVVDARALWKFLVNPHDNMSLMILLRSPWYYTPDWRLSEWMECKPESLWRDLERVTEPTEALVRLRAARARLDEEGLTRTFEAALLESSMLDLSLANDPAGRKESNLWKLILQARALEKDGGGSALDFLSANAGDNALEAAEGDAASAQEPNCINLMTIHGAKGLQFDHVILPGLGESPRRSAVPEFAAENRIFHFPTWDDAENKAIPSPLDHLANRERGRRETEEYDRWLYVAVTRAKESLTLAWHAAKSDSWAARSEFCAADAGAHEREFYRFEVSEEFTPPTRFVGVGARAGIVREPWGQIYPAAEERRSVTDVIHDGRPAATLSEDAGTLIKRWRSQTVGTRIHRALEALKYGASADAPDFAEGLDFVMNLRAPPMRELIAAGETEWGFQVQTPKRIIEGQIDLWAKLDGVLYVVDYKSGAKRYAEDAFRQLGVYAWALRRFGHLEPAKLVVIYPVSRDVETRDFTPALLRRWELEFGGAEVARESYEGLPLFDRGHGNVEGDLVR